MRIKTRFVVFLLAGLLPLPNPAPAEPPDLGFSAGPTEPIVSHFGETRSKAHSDFCLIVEPSGLVALAPGRQADERTDRTPGAAVDLTLFVHHGWSCSTPIGANAFPSADRMAPAGENGQVALQGRRPDLDPRSGIDRQLPESMSSRPLDDPASVANGFIPLTARVPREPGTDDLFRGKPETSSQNSDDESTKDGNDQNQPSIWDLVLEANGEKRHRGKTVGEQGEGSGRKLLYPVTGIRLSENGEMNFSMSIGMPSGKDLNERQGGLEVRFLVNVGVHF